MTSEIQSSKSVSKAQPALYTPTSFSGLKPSCSANSMPSTYAPSDGGTTVVNSASVTKNVEAALASRDVDKVQKFKDFMAKQQLSAIENDQSRKPQMVSERRLSGRGGGKRGSHQPNNGSHRTGVVDAREQTNSRGKTGTSNAFNIRGNSDNGSNSFEKNSSSSSRNTDHSVSVSGKSKSDNRAGPQKPRQTEGVPNKGHSFGGWTMHASNSTEKLEDGSSLASPTSSTSANAGARRRVLSNSDGASSDGVAKTNDSAQKDGNEEAIDQGASHELQSRKSRATSESKKSKQNFQPPFNSGNGVFSPLMGPSGMPNVNDLAWMQMQLAMGQAMSTSRYPSNFLQNPGMGILADPLSSHQNNASSGTMNDLPASPSKTKTFVPTAKSSGSGSSSLALDSKDKNEHKQSLDFIKSFFDNDPEVQYNRSKGLPVQRAAPVIGVHMAKQMRKTPTATMPIKAMNPSYMEASLPSQAPLTGAPELGHDSSTLSPTSMKSQFWQKTALSKCGPIDSVQARSLIEQLVSSTYECMVCCDAIMLSHAVWSCGNCYHIFHLSCIKRWARSETAAVKDESGWRCPGCQHVSTRPPNKYFCFCGKVRDPDWNPRDGITPHSCGEVCMKKRTTPPCDHNCNELCHPGPCPSCPVMVTKHCPCGKSITKMRCGQVSAVKCDSKCLKLLKCGKHHCQLKCHEGPCPGCAVKIPEGCYCGKDKRILVCGSGEVQEFSELPGKPQPAKTYSCQQICDLALSCNSHSCKDVCHPGACKECLLLPHKVVFCPCGKIPVTQLLPSGGQRQSCKDPVPTCDSFCGKKLNCGPKGSSHLCMMKCHTGPCQPCDKTTPVKCRCGATQKEIPCTDLKPEEVIFCERKCNKKRRCGRHKCNQKCCTEREHSCNIICGKKLPCGTHKCEEVCHAGFCPPCWRAGFDELACSCGETILYPPIACGTKPPECKKPCQRQHACAHPPQHTCHSDEACPPCTVLVNKQCMGGHEMWKNVSCHLMELSCGRPCGKVLRCGLHTCNKTCHKGPCLEQHEQCLQPCPFQRRDCSHPCSTPCHVGMDCPSTPCKAQIIINCRCGRKSANVLCLAGNINAAYQRFTAEMLSGQMRGLQAGQPIDLSGFAAGEKRPKFLDCDEECSRIERNKRLAEALGVDANEVGHFNHIQFSPFLREEAKIQLPFIQMLENVLENLVLVAKKSSQSQLHHAFPPMNSTQRRIIHEMADAFGCRTFSMDQEPKRNTVVIATKDSFIPNVKLSVITEREIMKPPPQPVMIMSDDRALIMGSHGSGQVKQFMEPVALAQHVPRPQMLLPHSLAFPMQPVPNALLAQQQQAQAVAPPNYFDGAYPD